MLRLSRWLLRVQSHQKNRSQTPHAGTRFGRVYNRGYIRYGFGGFGMSVYSPKKDRRFRVLPPFPSPSAVEMGEVGGTESGRGTAPLSSSVDHSSGENVVVLTQRGLTSTTRALSPNFRLFALADNGVLVVHPTHQDIMRWGQEVLEKETEALEKGSDGPQEGSTAKSRRRASMDDYTRSRIQAILANNTTENVSLSHWRKNHMWHLIKAHGRLQRRWGVPDTLQGARTTLFNNK